MGQENVSAKLGHLGINATCFSQPTAKEQEQTPKA